MLSCRLHYICPLPCYAETPASWMMRGALDFLTSNNPNARLLRQAYVIYVVPMLNPDGVMFGNNRCGLAGVDLNRQWKTPVKTLHPTVFALKTMLQEQKAVREISMYIDLHGHSRKYNIFMYGCEEKKRPNPKVRAFPKFFSLHGVGKKYVSYADCSFHVRKGREATARVVVSRDIGIPLSYTVEATFCGADAGPLKYCHMNTGHLEEVGIALVDSFIQYSMAEGDVSDANILNSRKIDNQNSRNTSCSGQNNKKKGSVKSVPAAESTRSGSESGRMEYVSDSGGDDVLSDDDASCVGVGGGSGSGSGSVNVNVSGSGSGGGSVTGGGGGGGAGGGSGYALEKSAGTFSLRGVRTAGASSSGRSPGGIAILASGARSRSDTAPLSSTSPFGSSSSSSSSKDKAGGGLGGSARLLARDDGFSFSESVSANRMLAGMGGGAPNKPSSASPAFPSESSERYFCFVIYCFLNNIIMTDCIVHLQDCIQGSDCFYSAEEGQ
jgi:hypothetical protein